MTLLGVNYSFYPVGQGLFSSGHLYAVQRPSRPFHWVYDCGTTSAAELLDNAIDNFEIRFGPGRKQTIDLVVISHFDSDHISGLVKLLSKFSIRALLLPYMPLWQRLVSAFAEGLDPQQDVFQFFLNPVAYLANIDGAEIEQIILVPPSGEERPPDGGGEGGFPGPEGEGPWPLDIDRFEPKDEDEKKAFQAFRIRAGGFGPRIEFMRSGGGIRAAGIWEFVPYNDATLAPKATPAFRAAVEKLQDKLLDPWAGDRRNTLRELKAEYDKAFGSTGRNRNEISLFLYGGPFRIRARSYVWASYSGSLRYLFRRRDDAWVSFDRASILYTGDGYLDTPERTNRLLNYLGEASRAKRLFAVQVMHHGAQSNWHQGVAGRLAPVVSIFSSDPKHWKFRHPHRPVLRDFAKYCPIRVDRRAACHIEALIGI